MSDRIMSGLNVIANLLCVVFVTPAWTAAHFWVFQACWIAAAAIHLLALILGAKK